MALLAFAVAGEPLGNVTALAGLTSKITGGLGCDCFFASYDCLHDQTSVRINFEHHLTFKNRINYFFGRVNNFFTFFDLNSNKLRHTEKQNTTLLSFVLADNPEPLDKICGGKRYRYWLKKESIEQDTTGIQGQELLLDG
jgi:hypothetical protein